MPSINCTRVSKWPDAIGNVRHLKAVYTPPGDSGDPLGLRLMQGGASVVTRPIARGIGGLIRPISPDEIMDSWAERTLAETNARHPFILDPNHVVTNAELRNNVGELVLAGATAKLPFLGGSTAAEEVAPEGIVYLRTDLNGEIAPYVGQTKNEARYIARQAEHARDFPDADFDFSIITTANAGRDLDIAEHMAIQDLTGGVRARRSPLVSNLNDPVGPARRPHATLYRARVVATYILVTDFSTCVRLPVASHKAAFPWG